MTELTNTRARREHGRLRKQAVVRRVPRSALITGRAMAVRQQGHARRFGAMTVINPAETNALKCPVPQDNTPVEITVVHVPRERIRLHPVQLHAQIARMENGHTPVLPHVSPVRRFLLRTGRVRLAHRRDLARQYHATAGTRQMERLAKKSHVPPTAKLVPTVRHAQLATAIMHWKTAFVWISVETMSNLKAALAKSIVFRITEKSVCLQSALPAVHTGKK